MSNSSKLQQAYNYVRKQQQYLVRQILEQRNKDKDSLSGIDIYRNNLKATATKVLDITFPTVSQLIGGELLALGACQLLKLEPPQDGDWACWGGTFPDLLEQLPQLGEYPYIADCARLDWLIHQTERKPNTSFDHTSINLLAERHLDDINIRFADTFTVITSNYPIYELWHIHHGDSAELYTRAFRRRIIKESFKQFILVYRPIHKAHICLLSKAEYEWVKQLMAGRSIGEALDRLTHNSVRFEQWLPQMIKLNGISRLSPKE